VELLLDFLREARLDRVGAFTYSEVAGAPANALPGAVPEELKRERHARVMQAQQRIAEEIQRAKVGRVLPVIVDDVGALPGEMLGRSAADAPEIDGRVWLDTDGTVVIGDVVEAEVVGADAYDLWARARRTLPWRPAVPLWGADRSSLSRAPVPDASRGARTPPR